MAVKCSSVGSCLVFMPRIDLWAVETLQQVPERSNSSPSSHLLTDNNDSCLKHGQVVDSCPQQHKSVETEEVQCPSHAWSSFVEQVESICVSTSLMILATSEVPYKLLPQRVKQFFESRASNCSHSIPLESTVPRFSVLLGGNFNRDMVINLSATELSRDLIQPVVQLIQQRNHAPTSSCKDPKNNGFSDFCTDTQHDSRDHASVSEHEGRTQPTDVSSVKVPPPNNKTLKGRSSLLLAISTFGYQILRYPHFAELCWVTSKLKEGPCMDVAGPWKGWPFNSCIVRPSDSVENVAVACGSSNIKSKENLGLVRGLIAVGLSAYKGVYASHREVALDVRRVLELLVGEINAKIQAGKDRYQYVRLLSQVAYLEDVVNSWAHALQSLETEVQMKVVNPKVKVGCLDNTHTDTDNLVKSDKCKPAVSSRNSHESSGMEGNTQGFATENANCLSSSNGVGDIGPDNEGKSSHLQEGSALHIVHPNASPNKNLEGSTVANQSASKIINEQNGINLEPSESERNMDFGPSEAEWNTDLGPNEIEGVAAHGLSETEGTAVLGPSESEMAEDLGPSVSERVADLEPSESERTAYLAVGDTHSGSMNHSNGFAFNQFAIHCENGPSSSGQMHGAKFSDSQASCDRINGLSKSESKIACNGEPDSCEDTVAINLPTSKATSVSADSEIICMYHCCSECLRILHVLMQKILIHTLELNGSNWTVEDVHDVVASLSVDLLSAVRKVYLGNSSISFEENVILENPGTLSECPGINTCHCKRSGNGLVAPVECSCHTLGECGTENSTSSDTQFGYDPKFVFRDGVLVPVDSNKDISFHCKYETLCLCSLIKSIVVMKQPID